MNSASSAEHVKWKSEKINGDIYYMSPSSNPKHSRVIGRLYNIFFNYLKDKACEVFADNIDIYLDKESDNYVIPDISILCDPKAFTDNGYYGVPSLIIEVISPTSVKRDRFIKKELYQKFGVKEFWLVDYRSKNIEQYILIDENYVLINLVEVLSSYDYNNRLTECEKNKYSTLINVGIFDGLVVDAEELFK